MALQHTRHVSRRSGCTQTVLRSLRRTVGHQIPQISTPLTITCGGHAGKVSQTAAEAKDDRRAESRFAINMGRHATRADQQGRQGFHQTPEDFLDYGAWIMMTNAYYVISIVVWLADEGGSVCLITPPAVAVFAGDNVSLTCITDTFVTSWTRGIAINNSSVVFQAANSLGLNPIPRIVVDGYLVNDSVGSQVVLIMNSASTAQADRYYCTCYSTPPSYAATSVTVLASKPTFSITSQITDGGPIIMKCNISFNGTADASIMIKNISGQVDAEGRKPGTYPSTDLQVFNLDCNDTANSSIDQTYTCQVNLTDNSIPIYSKEMMTSVQWVPVQKVQINPFDKSRCSSDSKCAINQTINCIAEGNPYPAMFRWTVVLNGSQLDKTTSGQLLTLSSTGNYTIQCTAFNMIGGITYNGASEYFKTEVIVDGPPTPQPDTTVDHKNNIPLTVGIVVGIGGGIIVIVLTIVIFLFCKRRKREQKKVEVYTTLDVQRSVPMVMPQQHIYTDLQTSPVNPELQHDHRVASETCESVIVA